MKGYSKMKFIRANKSRSMDFADLLSFPQTPKNPTKPTSKTHHTNKVNTARDSVSDLEYEDVKMGGNFGGVLRRNSSVSSATSLQSSMKRAFSMRRSSSVSERYRRIHDQPEGSSLLQSPPIDDEEAMDGATKQTTSVKKKMMKKLRNGKILKACKRLFGL